MGHDVWLVKGEGVTLVVDCGVAPALAHERQLNGYISPAQALARMGVDADRVDHVIITHIHFDHASGVELFPRATIYLQEREFTFWLKNPVARKPPFRLVSDPRGYGYLTQLEERKQLVLTQGDQEILPGIQVLLAPGHTPGLQAVAVNTAKGIAILGSDCGHIFRNYQEQIPSCFITDMVAWMKSYDKLKAAVSSSELLFPGHDIRMATDYPEVAEGITRLL